MKHSDEIIAMSIDIATGENDPTLRYRTLTDGNNDKAYVTIDNIPDVLKLQGARAKCHFHEKFKKFTKECGLPNYVLLHEDPHTQKGRKNIAFAPATHVLAFLRDRRSLNAIALVKRIDDEIARRTHSIQLKDAEDRIDAETERANEAEMRAEDEADRANQECELRVRQEAAHKRQIEALKRQLACSARQ